MASEDRESVWHARLQAGGIGVLAGEGDVSTMRKIIVALGLRVRQREVVHLRLNTEEIAVLIAQLTGYRCRAKRSGSRSGQPKVVSRFEREAAC